MKTAGSPAEREAEAVELARAAQLEVSSVVRAVRDAPHPRWFVGAGKVAEITGVLADLQADILLVNHDLSAGQQRDLESELGARVITRTELILVIFAARARTYEGKLQVELAQLKHAQTRLVRGWTHLDRQKGGIGMRGAGETQIEMDQRVLSEQVSRVQKRLDEVARRRDRNRLRRRRTRSRSISLVGYTNAGKSTLFNALTDAGVLVADKLFATLDPTMRRLSIPGAGDVILADTVGFIGDLPHDLVNAFSATLEEVSSADLLLHVVDAAGDNVDARVAEVNEVLAEIGAGNVPTIIVYNKLDALPEGSPLGQRALAAAGGCAVAVSAVTGDGLEGLVDAIGRHFGVLEQPANVLLPAHAGGTRAWLYRIGAVVSEKTTEDGRVSLAIRGDPALMERLRRMPEVLLQVNEAVPRISPLLN